MYCNKSTVELAISKGYKHCTCSTGGYPDCICDGSVNSPVRLDDIQRWLRLEKNIDFDIEKLKDGSYRGWVLFYKNREEMSDWMNYDKLIEECIIYGLELI